MKLAVDFQKYTEDLAIIQELRERGLYRSNYAHSASKEQIEDADVDPLFPKSQLTQAVETLPSLMHKTNPDWIGDARLDETVKFRIKQAVYDSLHSGWEAGITAKDIEDGSPREVTALFRKNNDDVTLNNAKIGLFKNTEFMRKNPSLAKIGRLFTTLVEGSFTGGISDIGGDFKDIMRDIYIGRSKKNIFINDYGAKWKKMSKTPSKFVGEMAEELGFKKGSEEYSDFHRNAMARLNRFKDKDMGMGKIIKSAAYDLYHNKPITKLEKYLMKNKFTDPDTDAFVGNIVKDLQKDNARASDVYW